jgi:methylenetetrahydrofolate--tRNA-(uracil-5-)-methyltransferase
MSNIGTGLLAGINAARYFHGQELLHLPETTLLGALCEYISTPNPYHFQPKNASYRNLPPFEPKIKCKADRFDAYAQRSKSDLDNYLKGMHEDQPPF